MTLRRMNAYRLVLAAAALTIFVTAALTTALASFAGAALPQAAHRELVAAVARAAVTKTVSAAAASTSRYAFIRRSVMDPRSARTVPTIGGTSRTGPSRAFRKISC